jgi:uncharacterized protein (TIGR02099 family)
VKPVRIISWRRHSADWLRQRLWWFVASGILLLAIWVVVAKQLLAMLPAWRGDLEALVESRIQTPLEIGQLSGHMSGLSPVFVFEDVRLPGVDPARPGLTLERVELTVDVLPSLLQRTLRARSLLIRGIEVRINVDEEGRVSLHGIEALGSQSASARPPIESLLAILYRQKRIQIENIHGTLAMAGMPELEVANISMAMLSSGERHRLALVARTAADEIDLDIRLDLRGDAYHRGEIDARGYVSVDLNGVEPWLLPHWPFDLRPQQLTGAVKGWFDIRRGDVHKGALRSRIDGLTLSGAPLAEPWSFTRLEADAVLESVNGGYQLEVGQLLLADQQGQWQPGAVTLGWNVEAKQDWQVAFHDVDLAPFTSLLLRIPWRDDHQWLSLSARLEALQPTGMLRRLSLRGEERSLGAVSTRFENVSLKAEDRRPGVSGLSGWINGGADGGFGRIESPSLTLNLPEQFRQPLSGALDGVFRWRYDGEQLDVHTGWLQVVNPDARARLLAGLRWRREQVPELTLIASLTEGRALAASNYIPRAKLSPAAASWLDNAFVGGTLDTGLFLHEGPVVIDPARQQDRTLQMLYAGDDLTLRFLPEWPLLTNVSAKVLINGRHISGRDVSAELIGSTLRAGSVDIPSRQDDEVPRLIVSGKLTGPAHSIGTLLQGTPLAAQMPAEVSDWQISAGEYQGHVLLHWPLAAGQPGAMVRASGELAGAAATSEARRLAVTDLNTAFFFDLDQGMTLPAFSARLFDQPVTGSVATNAGVTRVNWQGNTDMKTVRNWLQLDWLKPASGAFGYVAELALPWRQAGNLTMRAESTMEDLVVALPAPLGKTAGKAAPLKIELTGSDEGTDLAVRYQNWLSARVLLGEGELQSGRIRLGGGAALRPAREGLSIEGRLPSLVLADWTDELGSGSGIGGSGDWPAVNLDIGRLDLFGYPVTDVQVVGQPQDGSWRVAVEAAALAGTLEVPDGYRQRGEAPMVLVADRAVLVSAPSSSSSGLSPLSVPVMDVKIDSLILDEQDMGRWQLALRPLGNGVALEEMDALWRSTAIRGRLLWTRQGKQDHSQFIGSLDSRNLARSLRQWQLEPFIESDDARAVLDVNWPGMPTDMDYLSLQGQASVAIGPGRFPKTDSKTSALRVLGVFNITTVSRRLRLDFTDLYKKGLSFEEISGDFNIDGSLVSTSNLQIKSPSAELRLRGEMDIEAETLDHYMEVTLPVSSNLYVGCLAGPAACAGIFVVERLWGDRLEKMTSLGYRVTGSWDEPKVEEVQGMFERRRSE